MGAFFPTKDKEQGMMFLYSCDKHEPESLQNIPHTQPMDDEMSD